LSRAGVFRCAQDDPSKAKAKAESRCNGTGEGKCNGEGKGRGNGEGEGRGNGNSEGEGNGESNARVRATARQAEELRTFVWSRSGEKFWMREGEEGYAGSASLTIVV
jgi:hypothetical protein